MLFTVYRVLYEEKSVFGTRYYVIVRKKSPYERVKVCVVRQRELFECPELKQFDFVCIVGCKAKFQKEKRIYETNRWLAFWMLLPA